jgi:hypothetical protein
MSETSSMLDSGKSLLIAESTAPFSALEHECTVFTHYVIKQKPSAYVLGKYRQAHSIADFTCTSETRAFDRLLLYVSATHPVLTRLVDAYTAIFMRSSIVRRKWILLLAILESCSPSYRCFDSPESSNKKFLLVGMMGKGLVFLFFLFLSILLLMPLHLGFSVYGKLVGRS